MREEGRWRERRGENAKAGTQEGEVGSPAVPPSFPGGCMQGGDNKITDSQVSPH